VQIELLILATIIIAYGTFTTLAIIGISKLTRHSYRKTEATSHFFSIIIAARNEENTIISCLEEIAKQSYEKKRYELIFVDDCSEDNTLQKASDFLSNSPLNYQILSQKKHQGKKKCLADAISCSKGSIIITSDADITYRHLNWLSTIAEYFENQNPNLVIMPIDFETQKGFLPSFQIIENIAITSITSGFSGLRKAFMCNGANLAFKKEAYLDVNGYQKHLQFSSGEDVFLLEDLKKLNPQAIHYLFSRNVIVKTKPQTSFKSFIAQRIRWASKAKHNRNYLNFLAGLIILLANLLFPIFYYELFHQSIFLPYLSIFVLAKLLFDFLLLFLASDFLGRIKYIWWLVPFESIYWIYALIVGITSLFWKPYWKGKKIN
jgi:poly-beta-1,6-N-acetyl-D-glucosamine synthase